MKKLLKYLLVPVFASSTTLTVVACGTSEPVWNQDILSSAVGQMQDHTFNMSQDLLLAQIPATGTLYNTLTNPVKNRINNYYSSLVSSSNINWGYPDVAVSVTAEENNSPFQRKYGENVESRINLDAHLTYKGLQAKTTIVVKISNDKTSPKQKIDAIGSTLTTYLATNPVFNFKTLFKDGLMSDDASANKLYFEGPLRTALFIDTTETDPVPFIDVAGVDIAVELPSSPTKIYDLTGVETINEKKVITGSVQHLDLILYDQRGNSAILNDKTLKVAQNINDASNHITTMLTQGESVLQFKQATLPTESQTLEEYYTVDATLKGKVQQKFFDIISLFYPASKINGSETWSAERVSFPNESSTPFIKKNPTDTQGYFFISVKFEFHVDSNTVIDSTVYDIKLNLSQA
ncbi:hypothetical protein [Spiroplasma platyhelix]|uniref:Lipoprotein n=1 Tax=Spiroplasma platyhelix PALS-1 TaxID=1276218 RepID=A0A846U0C0_9MOLU|nr:hypothetical protein [Spiroplasma platyhelix]MBE4703913.1 hypothetical protein [Spiroplasma platyhelix PALS-1]NKE38286.1 hypothetical protein [Spiroplasma platyhelix PALS-1]UJB29171.1 hypothetical protein SPLAT_v1c04070 [Spiroplasma platyhelix PALS-1]